MRSLEGVLIGGAGERLTGAFVRLVGTGQETTTDERGEFAFHDLSRRSQEVEAEYGNLRLGVSVVDARSDRRPAVLTLTPGFVVDALVTAAGSPSQPIEGAVVSVDDRAVAYTDEFGKCSATVARGSHSLAVAAPGFCSARRSFSIPASGAPLTKQVVCLRRGVAISGTVVDTHGAALEGAGITVISSTCRAQATIAAGGRWALDAVDPGRYMVDVRSLTHRNWPSWVVLDPNEPEPTVVVEMRALSESDRERPHVRGCIVWASTGLPVIGARVRGLREDVTGDDGRFEIPKTRGPARVTVQLPEQAIPAAATVAQIASDEDVTILVPEMRRVRGRVVRATIPVTMYGLALTRIGDGFRSENAIIVSSPEGGFELPLVAPGRFRLSVADPFTSSPVEATLDVDSADVELTDIELPPPSSISGVVRNEGGAPVAGVRVLCRIDQRAVVELDGPLSRWFYGDAEVVTSADGRFSIPRMTRDRLETIVYAVHAKHGASDALAVVASHDGPLELTLRASGTVVGIAPCPVGAVWHVALRSRDVPANRWEFPVAAAAPCFEVRDVPVGHYLLSYAGGPDDPSGSVEINVSAEVLTHVKLAP